MKLNLTLCGTFKMIKQPYMRDMAKLQDLTYVPFIVANEVRLTRIGFHKFDCAQPDTDLDLVRTSSSNFLTPSPGP